MSENEPPERLRELDARLRRFREKTRDAAKRDGAFPQGSMSGFGMAMRIGTELVAALILGVGIGFFLDKWLGTTPWFLVVFFFLGASAGVLNVYRMASGQGLAPENGSNEITESNGPDGTDDGNQSRDG